MEHQSFDDFEREARADGFAEVLERQCRPYRLASHTHPFAVRARVVQGEMWLTVGDDVRHLRRGDAFALERDVAHAERYGPQGATYWVARRA